MQLLTLQFSFDHGGETWKLPKLEAFKSVSETKIAGEPAKMRTYNVRLGWLKTAIGLHIGVTRVSQDKENQ